MPAIDNKDFQGDLELRDVPFPAPNNVQFTFIDLFAGIGGFRIPLQKLGGKCVFSYLAFHKIVND